MLSPVSVAMFFHKRGYGVVMGLSLLCFRRVAYEGLASCSSMFQSPPFTLHDGDAVDGYPPVGSIQSHVHKSSVVLSRTL